MKILRKIEPGTKQLLKLEEDQVMVEIGDGAEVTVRESLVGNKTFVLGEGARLNFYSNYIGEVEDKVVVELRGDGSEVFSQMVFFGDEGAQEMSIVHKHVGRNTKSRMIAKGAVTGRAHSHMVGTIRMEPGSSGADGTLEEHNLLLGDDAQINAEPNLEISHHKVKASHSATMERVDDEKLFYLTSRGLPKKEAQHLIVEGFFWDVLQNIGNEEQAQQLLQQILTSLK